MLPGLLRLLLRRAASEPQFVALQFVGLTLAVAIASGVFIYLDALGQAALNQRLQAEQPIQLNIAIRARIAEATTEEHHRLSTAINSSVSDPIAAVTDPPVVAAKSPTLLFDQNQVAWPNARAFIASVNQLESAATLVAGSWPTRGMQPLQVAASKDDASYLGASVGDVLTLRTPGTEPLEFTVEVSGIYAFDEPSGTVAHALYSGLGADSRAFRITPLTVSEQSLTNDLIRLLPEAELRYYWTFPVRPDTIRTRDAEDLLEALEAQHAVLKRDLLGVQRITTLDSVVRAHLAAASISVGAMLAIGIVLAVASLSFAAWTSTRARELREAETQSMRARGATTRQETLLMAGENITIAVIALLSGPVIALAFVTAAGRLPGLSDLTGGGFLPTTITPEAAWAAAAIFALGIVAMVLPALNRSAHDVIQRVARPPRLTVVQRYYLDIPILGLALIAVWQISQGDLRLASDAFGTGFSQQLALAMPAAIGFGAALAALRFMPLVMSLVGNTISRVQSTLSISPAVTLALWSLARNPRANFGLMLLTILAVSVATLVAILAPSLESHATESARYLVGADARVPNMIVRSQSRLARELEPVRALKGIETVSPATRALGTIAVPGSTEAVTVLGIDHETFGQVINWRDDFADFTADELVDAVRSRESGGIPIPPDTVMLTALVKPDIRRADAGLTVRLRGTSGRYYSLTIGTMIPRSITLAAMEAYPCEDVGVTEDGVPLKPEDWCRIAVPLTAAQIDDGDETDLSLEFIGISERPSEEVVRLGIGSAAISDISALLPDGTLHVLTRFDDIIANRTPGGGFDELGARIDPASASGTDGAILTWSQPQRHRLNGVTIGTQNRTIGVIANRWFRDTAGANVGERLRLILGRQSIDIEIRGFVDYFPTFGHAASPFLIADIRAVRDVVAIDNPNASDIINELWIKLDHEQAVQPASIAEPLAPALAATPLVQFSSDERGRFEADPFASLGWTNFLTFALVAIIAITALAFSVNGWTTYKLRNLEFAVLRSLGLTQRQSTLLITLEQTIPPIIAAVIGLGVGIALSAVMLPYMAGQDIESLAPPMLVSIGWLTFGTACAFLAIALFVSIGTVTAWTRRQQIDVVLRAGGGIG